MGLVDKDAPGVDLTSTGDVAEFQPVGETTLTIVMENAGSSVTVDVQVREDGGTYRTVKQYSSVSTIKEVGLNLSAYEVRVRITSSGTSGTADFYVAAGD